MPPHNYYKNVTSEFTCRHYEKYSILPTSEVVTTFVLSLFCNPGHILEKHYTMSNSCMFNFCMFNFCIFN